MPNSPHITSFGLPGIDRVPFGMHACHFYSGPDQLVAALVPYCLAGLRAHERCLWVAAPPVSARDAVEALRVAWHGVDAAIDTGALHIFEPAQLDGRNVLQFWLEAERCALDAGYNGIRVAGNTSFLEPSDWATFMEYEHAMTGRFNGRRIVMLCSYPAAQCNDQQISDVRRAHHCALETLDDDGEVFAIPRFRGGSESRV
jgi:hypothetical protein